MNNEILHTVILCMFGMGICKIICVETICSAWIKVEKIRKQK